MQNFDALVYANFLREVAAMKTLRTTLLYILKNTYNTQNELQFSFILFFLLYLVLQIKFYARLYLYRFKLNLKFFSFYEWTRGFWKKPTIHSLWMKHFFPISFWSGHLLSLCMLLYNNGLKLNIKWKSKIELILVYVSSKSCGIPNFLRFFLTKEIAFLTNKKQ